MGAIRVLLADDHTIVREATAEILEHQPDMHVVGQAEAGEEAVELARELHPDVAVMDIAMPRLNGLEATRRITAECPRCRVLVLTAHEEERYIIQLPQVEAAADAAGDPVDRRQLLDPPARLGRRAWRGVARRRGCRHPVLDFRR
jgi:DNA-binding NarL/FixJ family response regulator